MTSATAHAKHTGLSRPLTMAIMTALSGGAGAAYAADQTHGLEEIVVTATRRAVSVVDIPYNISAVSGDALEAAQITDTVDLVRTVPAVSIVDRGYRNSGVINGVIIRGLNVNGSALGDYALSTVPTVSTYVNDTPLYANFLLKDIERVEVLRGPQGTLYGSGSLGGTVRYIMRDPRLNEFGGDVGATLSSVDGSDSEGWSADVTLNVPLGQTAAFRVTGSRIDYPGLVDYANVYVLDANGIPVAPNGVLEDEAQYRRVNDADTVDIDFVRAALLWAPSDEWKVLLSGQYQQDEIGGRRQETVGLDGNDRVYGDYENGSIQLEPSSKEATLGALEIDVDLGFATLTSSSSYYEHDGDSISENTGFYAQVGFLASYSYYPRPMASAVRTYSDKAFVQELRLVSQGERALDYVVGLFYQDQDQRSTQQSYVVGFKQWWDANDDVDFPPELVFDDNDFNYRRDQTFEEKALYGELTWHATDRLHLTGGLRYFDNKTENDTFMAVGVYDGFREPTFAEFDDDDSDMLYKANIAYDLAEDHMVYATFSQGYRRGGTNAVPTTGNFAESPAFQVYSSDSVDNYEVGFKGRTASLQYSVAAFYVDWEDVQLDAATPLWGFFAAVNGESARTQGVEAEVRGQVGAFDYSFGYAYVDAELTAPLCSPHVSREVCLASPNNAFRQLAHDGAKLPGVAEHTMNVSAGYQLQLGADWSWTNRISGYYQSETENAVSYSARFAQTLDGFQLWNFFSSFGRDSWDATLFVKNIFNEEGVTGVFKEEYMGTAPDAGYYGNGSKQFLSLPRTYGVTLNYRF